MLPCPRRAEAPYQLGDPMKDAFVADCCTYCGGMEPKVFLAALVAGAELIPTDKSYKAYVRAAGKQQQKVYFQHFDAEDRQALINMVNEKQIKFAYPGHFYVLPFFCKAEKED